MIRNSLFSINKNEDQKMKKAEMTNPLNRRSVKSTSDIFSVSSIRAVQALKSKEFVLTMLHNLSSSGDKAAKENIASKYTTC